MFVVPIGSNAPLYYFPWGTIGLISACSLVLLGSSTGLLPPLPELIESYGLVHGTGLHPVQWVASNFLHDGWAHLIGNMLFLWPFGLIVEGKLGWRAYLPLCLGLGVAESLLEQLCLAGPGISVGASSIIFGLMAVALVWAPYNDVEIAYGIWNPIGERWGTFDFPVLWLSALMIAKEAALTIWLDFPIGGELFHLVGAALGFGAGASMLQAGLVDCEGWDLWTVLRGQRRERAALLHTEARVLDGRSGELAALSDDEARELETGRKLRALTRIHYLLTAGRATEAWEEVRRTRQIIDGFRLGERDLTRVGQELLDAGHWREATEAFEEFIDRFPHEADVARLIVAEVLIGRQRRPAAALRKLEPVNRDRLGKIYLRRYDTLRAEAEALIDAGVIELEGQPWEST